MLIPLHRSAETNSTIRPPTGLAIAATCRHLLQHRPQVAACVFASRASTAAAATTNAGGRTPFRFAQASFSVWVWQQHCRQQVAASEQPQGQLSQGKRSALAFFGIAAGRGTPIEATTTAASVSAAAVRRRTRRQRCRTRRTTGKSDPKSPALKTPTA